MEQVIGVVGLGYVGLPVALAFARVFRVIGFDVSSERVVQIKDGRDWTGEADLCGGGQVSRLVATANADDLAAANTFIICVPTPVDSNNSPDLSHLIDATETVARYLNPGSLVSFESTVFPGATEEICIPRLERISGLRLNQDFFVGYSPERINPGDPIHRLENTTKVVSGSCESALDMMEELYGAVVQAGIYAAPSIAVAEAAKVIENTQRDLNIALMNELAQVFDLLGIDTLDVLAAAETKWNFAHFYPGLVGGHCIGVDPYYLTYRAIQVGAEPSLILAGRATNDYMGEYVAERVERLLTKRGRGSGDMWSSLVLGATFKENCADTRNSRVKDLVTGLYNRGSSVTITDPWVSEDHRRSFHGAEWMNWSSVEAMDAPGFDVVVLAVAHEQFVRFGDRLRSLLKPGGVIFDVKGQLPRHLVDGRL